MDIVLPFGKESKVDEFPLRQCIKSVHKFVADVHKIYVIGEQPKSVDNVFYIPHEEDNNTICRDRNIYDKIRLACDLDYISDPFLLVYDDYVFLKPYEYKVYHSGELTTENFFEHQEFYHTLKNTIEVLGRSAKRYAAHCPLLIDKDKFRNINVDWNRKFGYCIKTLYCNINGIEGEYHADFKLRAQDSKQRIYQFIKDEPLFSLPPMPNKYLREVLKELFE
jgi:hypothetical protein